MRIPARSGRSQAGRHTGPGRAQALASAGALRRAGGSAGSSLLDDAQGQLVPWCTAWRWQLARLSLALSRALARQVASAATGNEDQLAEDLALYLARYCLGLSLRDLAATAGLPRNTVARAVEAVDRLADGHTPARYGMRTSPPAPFWTALERAERELERVRDMIVAPVPDDSAPQDRELDHELDHELTGGD